MEGPEFPPGAGEQSLQRWSLPRRRVGIWWVLKSVANGSRSGVNPPIEILDRGAKTQGRQQGVNAPGIQLRSGRLALCERAAPLHAIATFGAHEPNVHGEVGGSPVEPHHRRRRRGIGRLASEWGALYEELSFAAAEGPPAKIAACGTWDRTVTNKEPVGVRIAVIEQVRALSDPSLHRSRR